MEQAQKRKMLFQETKCLKSPFVCGFLQHPNFLEHGTHRGCRSPPYVPPKNSLFFADKRLTFFVQKNPVRTVVVIEIKLYCDRKKLKTPSKGCLFIYIRRSLTQRAAVPLFLQAKVIATIATFVLMKCHNFSLSFKKLTFCFIRHSIKNLIVDTLLGSSCFLLCSKLIF